ncbi:MAG: hypothetical protein FWH11_11465 [Micrococcales bacterium]|nr:hypothetical protein [Micrococcales bacterium]
MSGLQVALLTGLAIGGGLGVVLWSLVRAQPDLGDVLDRLSPVSRRAVAPVGSQAEPGTQERVGIWAERTLPSAVLGTVPAQDLAVLGRSASWFYGKKVAYALMGLALPAGLAAAAAVAGFALPFAVPVVASLGLAAAAWSAPSLDVATAARQARNECARALTAFVELCALERASGAGAAQAMDRAAQVGDSWLFVRIREELARAAYDRTPPWDSLDGLAARLGLPELSETADILRLAGDENAKAYEQLRARAASMRTALLADEIAVASKVEDRMYLPTTAVLVVFLVEMLFPSLIQMIDVT